MFHNRFLNNITLVLTVMLLYSACGLKQPVASQQQQFGNVLVMSTPPGAEIFIDRQPTGKTTPDTLQNLPAGELVLRTFIDGYSAVQDSQLVTIGAGATVIAEFDLVEITDPAVLIVSSTPDAADILIDGKFSGKFTPDTLIVPAGERRVRLEKSSFSPYQFAPLQLVKNDTAELTVSLSVQSAVLVESFANNSCLPCTTSARLLLNFEQQIPPENAVIIEYFTNWPNFSDALFLHDPMGNMSRIQYYQIGTIPAMYMSGQGTNPLNFSQMLDRFNSEFEQLNRDISISLARQTGDSLRVQAAVGVTGPVPTGDLRLFIAVKETEISFTRPPGANGLSRFYHVFRGFMTPNDGLPLSVEEGGFKVNLSKAISGEWDLRKIAIIGFVQNMDTGEILQATEL